MGLGVGDVGVEDDLGGGVGMLDGSRYMSAVAGVVTLVVVLRKPMIYG